MWADIWSLVFVLESTADAMKRTSILEDDESFQTVAQTYACYLYRYSVTIMCRSDELSWTMS